MKHSRLLPFAIMSLGLIGLSIGLSSLSNRSSYQRVEATTSYKTYYLYCPNPVTYNATTITWDQEEDEVSIYSYAEGQKFQMIKVGEHLYACTIQLPVALTNSTFYFETYIGAQRYRAAADTPFKASTMGDNNMVTMTACTSSYSSVGDRSTYTVSTAKELANTFNKVLGEGICDNQGEDTHQGKLSTAWNEISSLYTSLSSEEKEILTLASSESSDSDIKDFASLYNFIANKYSYTNFASRNLASRIDITNSNNVDNSVLLISVISVVTLLSLSSYLLIKTKKD